MTHTTDTPRVYVACLASYNNGILFGEWIDVPDDADDLREAIAAMLAKSPTPGAEEWAIHDTDGIDASSEWPDLDKLCEMAALIGRHGDAYRHYADNIGAEYATEDGFEDAYVGEWDSLKDYAEESFTECNEIPDHLANYIDWDAVARDFGYDHFTADTGRGTVYVYRSL